MKRVYETEIYTRLSNPKQAAAQKKISKDEKQEKNYIVKYRNRLFEKTKMKTTISDLMIKKFIKI